MNISANSWVIGVDFDNTIASYDELMHTIALERGLITAGVARNKKFIRDAIRALPDGEMHWRSLQVTAYGPRMHEAQLIEGVKEFFVECQRRNIPVYIVSHKTEYANFGEADVNLRVVAMAWLERHGFFAPGELGLNRTNVFFESTRAEKIERIKALRATHFIDDLEETFLESTFPHDVQKILLAAYGRTGDVTGVVPVATWRQIYECLLDSTELMTLTAMLGKPVQSVARIGKGGNSKVYRIVCEDGSRYAAKFYCQRTMDGLDRLEVEFSSLQFLWENGERCIPRPLAVDGSSQVALYQYVEGAEIDSRAVSHVDIEQMVSFAMRLKQLATLTAAEQLPRAAEACFSFSALHENILKRLERLKTVQGEGSSYMALHRFLAQEFTPALDAIVERAKARIGAASWVSELPRSAWTLSSSDFGFHNALRRLDGSIVLLDFEYFGKDDPAKMISDFVLHPAMELNESAKRSYVERMLQCFGADSDLPGRLMLSYPLFGLKWCMILLNEFVPKFLDRREFAVEVNADREHVRLRQLAKSERMLGRVVNELQSFPSWVKCA